MVAFGSRIFFTWRPRGLGTLAMNAYPTELVLHVHPFLLVSGLIPEREGGGKVSQLVHPTVAYAALCKALSDEWAQRGAWRVWAPPERRPRFHTVLVDYAWEYPPAKVRPGARLPSDTARRALSTLPPRSPLSPLHVGGPLFPDGILAPAWVRKHMSYLPAVHVVFLCWSVTQGTPLAQDQALVEAMAEVRAAALPRGIRAAVVLLYDGSAVDRAELDTRLVHLRRATGFDQRGSLFVLDTAAAQGVRAFVDHLEHALWEPALEYYRERVRRVKRNRARYPPPPSVAQPIMAAGAAAGVLRQNTSLLTPEGWEVRTATKLGFFAEILGDVNEAVAQYTAAYTQLMHACLGNTKILAPRTKRWAEAKVLADTLSLKLVKLHLYRHAIPAALHQFQRHGQRVAELSAGWGIGTSTYEYWSWLAKQFQLLSDLVESATRPPDGAQRLALLPPVPHPHDGSAGYVLSGPGTHLYHAALCTMERAACFQAVDKAAATEDELRALAREGEVDHAAVTVELLGSAYELFQHAHYTRHAHLAAARIALVYVGAGMYEEALPYIERALRWYRRDQWAVPRFLLVAQAAACAHAGGSGRAALPYLVEFLQRVPPEVEALQTHWVTVLRPLLQPADTPESAQAVALEPGAAAGLFTAHATFARGLVDEGATVAFQLVLALVPGVPISDVAWQSVRVYIQGRADACVSIPLGSGGTTLDVGTLGDEGTVSVSTPLDPRQGPLVITGAWACRAVGSVTFSNVIWTMDSQVAQVDLSAEFAPCATPHWVSPQGKVPLPSRRDLRTVRVQAAEPTCTLDAPAEALAGEVVKATIDVGVPLVHGMLVIPPDAAEAGAVILSSPTDTSATESHEHTLDSGASSVWLRVPQTSGRWRVRLYGYTSLEHDTPTLHTDHWIEVHAAFGMRVHTQWMPGPSPRTGRITTEVSYLGTAPLTLCHAALHVAGDTHVQAGPVQGPEEDMLWEKDDQAVWVTPLTERADVLPGNAHSSMALTWRTAPTAPLGTSHFLLASLEPPAPLPVQVQLKAPGSTMLHDAVELEVALSNTHGHALDVLLEVEPCAAFALAGVRRKHVSMLLPGEVRTVPVVVLARDLGLHALPTVHVHVLHTDGEPTKLPVPPAGVVEVVAN